MLKKGTYLHMVTIKVSESFIHLFNTHLQALTKCWSLGPQPVRVDVGADNVLLYRNNSTTSE